MVQNSVPPLLHWVLFLAACRTENSAGKDPVLYAVIFNSSHAAWAAIITKVP